MLCEIATSAELIVRMGVFNLIQDPVVAQLLFYLLLLYMLNPPESSLFNIHQISGWIFSFVKRKQSSVNCSLHRTTISQKTFKVK